MTTEERARWNALEVREPGQVPAVTPLAWQVAKHTVHADRLMNNLLPADFPHEVERGTAGDALAVLALRESIRRDVEHGRGTRVHEALLLGASWSEVARALDVEPDEARELLRTWAQRQRNMWLRNEAEGIRPFGLDTAAHEVVLALCERSDDEAPASTVAPAEEQHDDTEPVKESTRRYAEELRGNPGTASADGHTGWECSGGASLIVEASAPGPGKLGTHHGVIYACAAHRAAAVERITGAGYEVDPRPAPPGHRWNPWPCGHVTAHDAASLAALSQQGTGEQR
ncbi:MULTISPECIES: hypothetical protein [unclassified Streptomyces]|uniref:hypothetical protein n=1 Tax=unclassified Streptomyces TaxID=2593676 RepID=UPI000DADFE8C|nr:MULTISPECIES: hypothetical protein [unclassified Streptomyces]PZT74507.1 hypothetical protein DNK55_20630 [Streptomyces sp. AC1-42T]PZT82507.1 hypothetical protein DNK56_10815 [Streptomyces sp. AC1-42W]